MKTMQYLPALGFYRLLIPFAMLQGQWGVGGEVGQLSLGEDVQKAGVRG